MTPREVARCWLAAAEAGLAKPAHWQAWADALILRDDQPPEPWLIDLAAATTLGALHTWSSDHGMSDHDHDTAALGYLWHRYRDGTVTLADCLLEMGDLADGAGVGIECESFYALLNRLKATGDSASIARDAQLLCADAFRLATEQLESLRAGHSSTGP